MIIDILCLGILAIGFWMGYSRGIIRTIFGILSIFFGLLIAFKFSPVTTNLLENLFKSSNPLIFLLGFVLTFVAIMLLIRLVAKGLEKFLQKIKLNILNKVAGGILLSMVFGIFFSVLLWFVDQAGVISPRAKADSMTYPILEDVPEASRELAEKVKPLFIEFWNDANEMIEQLGKDKNN
ncbi:MAG: CvpA family protein [Saprospiraceae bacterium]|nr:CvpA family protein [Saprospiraceae bacterium]